MEHMKLKHGGLYVKAQTDITLWLFHIAIEHGP